MGNYSLQVTIFKGYNRSAVRCNFFDNGGHCNQHIQAGESMTAESSSKEKPSYSGYGYHGGGRKPTGLKRVSFCVSCQPEELQQIKELAAEAGKTVSRFLLDAVLKD